MRLNEHLEHPEGAVVFQHACKMGLEGIVSNGLGRATGRAGRRLAQIQEPGCARGEARGGRGLGK